MIKIVQGDLLQAPEDIIGHQVNCMGVMGSGVAYQIKLKYPEVFTSYKKLVGSSCPEALGKCQIVKADDGKFIANLFGQLGFSRTGVDTNYEKLEEALLSLKNGAKNNNKSVALPYNIGCGLGGGDWNIVYSIIDEVFKDYEATLYSIEEIE